MVVTNFIIFQTNLSLINMAYRNSVVPVNKIKIDYNLPKNTTDFVLFVSFDKISYELKIKGFNIAKNDSEFRELFKI